MSNIVNPYIFGNPIEGSEMFFGREDVFQFIRQTLKGQHRDNAIVLHGQQRTGKTSVLLQMRSRLDDTPYLCIFMNLQSYALKDLDEFLWALADRIIRDLRREYRIDLPRPSRGEFMAEPRSFFENEFLNQVWSAIGERHLLLMLDEFTSLQEKVRDGKSEREIFWYLKHLMQHYERLNFLFSLSRSLEELKQQYASLFNVTFCKKISFLESTAAYHLMTEPVKGRYKVKRAARERIYHVTFGHPCYTQLVCHCLFTQWRRQHTSSIKVQDVNKVLSEAMEYGSAVLLDGWGMLTPGEQTVLAGMATAIGQDNSAVDVKEVNQAWRRYNVSIPEDEMAKAIESLIARDIIVGQDKYRFAADLQRMWVQKNKRIEWVKEGIPALLLKKMEQEYEHVFLVWHQELKKSVQEWMAPTTDDRIKRNEHRLLKGSDLTEAMRWLEVRPADLSQDEQDFIRTGQEKHAQEEKGRYTRRVFLGLAAAGLAAAVGGAMWRILPPVPNPSPTQKKLLFVYRGHSDAVNAVVWSHDGKRVASGSDDKTVQVWNAADGNLVYKYFGHSSGVNAVAWSPDGKRLASASDDYTSQVWDATTGKRLLIYHHLKEVRDVAWSPDGQRIASASWDGTVQIWNAVTGERFLTYNGHAGSEVFGVAWSLDGKYIVSSGQYATVQVWDPTNSAAAAQGKPIYTYTGHDSNFTVNRVAWSHDSRRVASASYDGTAQVWDATTGGKRTTYSNHTSWVLCVAWSPNDQYIASGSNDQSMQVWNAVTRDVLRTYTGHTNRVKGVAWSPDGKFLVTASDDTRVMIWQAP